MSTNKNTCLSNCVDYDVNNIIFAEPKESEFKPPNGGVPMKNFRISMSTKNQDGTSGELVFALDESYCFGISNNTKKDDSAPGAPAPVQAEGEGSFGHSLALCLTNKESPTQNQLGFIKTLEQIIEHSKQHLVKVRKTIREFELEIGELKAMNKLIYRKRDKATGELDSRYGPMIYPKLIETKKDGGKIFTEFFDLDNESILDPRTLIGTSCYVRPVIKVEGIWIGSGKHALQLKVYECGVRLPSRSSRSLLRTAIRPQADSNVVIQSTQLFVPPTNTQQPAQQQSEDESGDESDNNIQEPAPLKPRTPSPVQVPVKKAGVKRVPVKK